MARQLKVLIVDNSEDDALLIADCLAQAGYELEWQRVQTSQALSELLHAGIGWDLILSDYIMPGFGALEALEVYRLSGLDIPFVLVSGSIGEEKAVEAMRAGVHDYILKDCMQRLIPAVERELREAGNRKARRSAVDENLRLNSELLEANNSLQEKIELLSRSRSDLEQVTWAASHDLKEPLRMVTMYTQLLLRRRPSSDDEREYSRYIRDGVERVTALIDGMITYSRNLRTPADLSSCAEAAGAAQAALKSLAESIAESGAEVTVDWLPSVRIDQTALIDVFQHLLLNALEYTREGVPARIHLSAVRNRDEICFSVRDNGIGIEPSHHAQIFQLFRRLHGAEHPGIGVGLPLCRRLIENYGGQLWLKSEPGIGSIFYFTLRAADRAASSAG